MTHKAQRMLRLLAVLLLLCQATEALAQQRWPEQKANEWYTQQPFLVGSNFNPATAVNEMEMWQADSFDPPRIDLELGWAENIGMNTMRVFLHDLAYKQDPPGFLRRLDQFLAICARHHIKPVLVLFDSCWDPFPATGRQPQPRAGVHNSGWVQSPGAIALQDPAQYPRLESYVRHAIEVAVRRARQTLRELSWFVVQEQRGGLQQGHLEYQVTLRVYFKLEGEEEHR